MGAVKAGPKCVYCIWPIILSMWGFYHIREYYKWKKDEKKDKNASYFTKDRSMYYEELKFDGIQSDHKEKEEELDEGG